MSEHTLRASEDGQARPTKPELDCVGKEYNLTHRNNRQDRRKMKLLPCSPMGWPVESEVGLSKGIVKHEQIDRNQLTTDNTDSTDLLFISVIREIRG